MRSLEALGESEPRAETTLCKQQADSSCHERDLHQSGIATTWERFETLGLRAPEA